MDSSYEEEAEEMGLLTQVPSQDRISQLQNEDSSDDEFTGFNLRPAEDLIDCSANKESDFSQFVANIVGDSGDDVHSSQGEFRNEFISDSPQLFDEPMLTMSATMNSESVQVSQIKQNEAKEDAEERPYAPELSDISDDELVSNVEAIERDFVQSTSGPAKCKATVDMSDFLQFKVPRTDSKMDEYAKKRIADATVTKINWALRVYDRWVNYRRSLYFKRACYNNSRQNRYVYDLKVSVKSPQMLSQDICDFIAEVCKENGQEYPGATIYDLVLMISLFLERERDNKRLISQDFVTIRNTLNHIMTEKSQLGLGIQRSKDDITEEQEQYLWQHGFLGEDTPDQLRLTVFFLLGVNFGLRAGQEHRDLVRYPGSQLRIDVRNNKECLIYNEFTSKNNQGGLRERRLKKPKEVIFFCNGFEPRCLVSLYRKYESMCPRPSDKFNAFYLRTDPKWNEPGRIHWYLRLPIGRNQLDAYIKKLMQSAGFSGNFSNHSLRATTCSRLYEKSVDEQLIAERTGHSSTAIRRYKHTSMKQKNLISDLLQVRPTVSGTVSNVSILESKKGADSGDHTASFQESQVVKVPKSKDGKGVKSSGKKAYETSPSVADVQGCTSSVNVNVPIKSGQILQDLKGLVNIHFHFNS